MTIDESEKIKKIYSDALKEHGPTYQAVLCANPERQEKRYQGMYEVADLNNKSILDIGCGLGYFYGYLKKIGWTGRYEGADINSDLLNQAKLIYPEAIFFQHDIVKSPIVASRADYAILCTVFNNEVSDQWNWMTEGLKNTWDSCNEGMAFTFITNEVPKRMPGMAYFSPSKVLEFCKSELSENLKMRTDLIEYTSCVYLYK